MISLYLRFLRGVDVYQDSRFPSVRLSIFAASISPSLLLGSWKSAGAPSGRTFVILNIWCVSGLFPLESFLGGITCNSMQFFLRIIIGPLSPQVARVVRLKSRSPLIDCYSFLLESFHPSPPSDVCLLLWSGARWRIQSVDQFNRTFRVCGLLLNDLSVGSQSGSYRHFCKWHAFGLAPDVPFFAAMSTSVIDLVDTVVVCLIVDGSRYDMATSHMTSHSMKYVDCEAVSFASTSNLLPFVIKNRFGACLLSRKPFPRWA